MAARSDGGRKAVFLRPLIRHTHTHAQRERVWGFVAAAALFLTTSSASGQTCNPGRYAWVPLTAGEACDLGACEIAPISPSPPFTICEDDKIAVGESPEGLVLSSDGCILWVANEQSCDVSTVDVVTFAEEGEEPDRVCVGRCAAAIDRNATDTLLFTADSLDDQVSRIDLATGGVTMIVLSMCNPVPSGLEWPEAVAVRPGGAIYVVLRVSNQVARITSPTSPPACEDADGHLAGPRGMAIRPNGRIWITNSGSNTITVVTPNLDFVTDIDVGANGPRGIAFSNDPGGTYAYVGITGAQPGGGQVNRFVVITTQDPPAVVGTYDFSLEDCFGPRGVAAHPVPSVGRVFVTCGGSNTVVVMDVLDPMNPEPDEVGVVFTGDMTAPYAAGPKWVGGPPNQGAECPQRPERVSGTPLTHCDQNEMCAIPDPDEGFPCSFTNGPD